VTTTLTGTHLNGKTLLSSLILLSVVLTIKPTAKMSLTRGHVSITSLVNFSATTILQLASLQEFLSMEGLGLKASGRLQASGSCRRLSASRLSVQETTILVM